MDGNHLPASEKRLKPLRDFRGAALPGQSLVVYAPEWGLVVDVLPAEDAHAQERALMGPVLERVREGELWLADRNFSTSRILRGVDEKKAAFIIREHGASPNPTALGEKRKVGRGPTGLVYEQAVRVEGEKPLELRRVEVHLDEPTEDGETVIRLLTNVPGERLGALEVAELYRKRWKVEPEDWSEQEAQSAEQLSEALLELAKKVKPSTMRKHPRAAKKKVKKGYVPGKVARRHVATARVLKGEEIP